MYITIIIQVKSFIEFNFVMEYRLFGLENR